MMFVSFFLAAATASTILVDVHNTPVSAELCVRQSVEPIDRDLAMEAQFREANPETPLVMPQYYWLVLCRNVTFDAERRRFVTAASRDVRWVAEPSLLGFDPTYELFQHDIINGASMVGLAWPWLHRNPVVRIVTTSMLAGVMRNALGTRVVVKQPQSVTYASLYIATPVYRGEDGVPAAQRPSWDVYGAHVFEHFTAPYFASIHFEQPLARRFLYLDRAPPLKRTAAFLNCRCRQPSDCNCSAIPHHSALVRLQVAVEAEGFEFALFQHVDLASDQRAFHNADVVAGPHGGAFSNSIWMKPGRTLIEINIGERMCFAGTALAAGVAYYRYQPRAFRGYNALQAMDVDIDHFARYAADIIGNRRSGAANTASLASPFSLRTAPDKVVY